MLNSPTFQIPCSVELESCKVSSYGSLAAQWWWWGQPLNRLNIYMYCIIFSIIKSGFQRGKRPEKWFTVSIFFQSDDSLHLTSTCSPCLPDRELGSSALQRGRAPPGGHTEWAPDWCCSGQSAEETWWSPEHSNNKHKLIYALGNGKKLLVRQPFILLWTSFKKFCECEFFTEQNVAQGWVSGIKAHCFASLTN